MCPGRPGYATVRKTEAKYQVLDSRESSCTCKDFLSLEEAFRFFGKCHSLRARSLPIHRRNHLIPAKFPHQQSGSYELHIQGTNAGFIGLTFWLSIMPSAILIMPPQAPSFSGASAQSSESHVYCTTASSDNLQLLKPISQLQHSFPMHHYLPADTVNIFALCCFSTTMHYRFTK